MPQFTATFSEDSIFLSKNLLMLVTGHNDVCIYIDVACFVCIVPDYALT